MTDLTPDEAREVTDSIRAWIDLYPTNDVIRAYEGRVWVALGYESWAAWCAGELGGFRLPVPQRREAVSELAGAGMSNRAIADAVGASEATVRRDREATGATNDAPVRGQDGKTYTKPEPNPDKAEQTPEPAERRKPSGGVVIDARHRFGGPKAAPDYAYLVDDAARLIVLAAEALARVAAEGGQVENRELLIETLAPAEAALGDALSEVFGPITDDALGRVLASAD